MDGFSVSPAELRQVAGKLLVLVDELDEHNVLGYSMEPGAVQHKALRTEIETFQQRLEAAVIQLRDDTRESSDRLQETAENYERIDGEGAARVSV
jgi:Excreted virulence factor EspC, type VII ESX diderm